MNFTLNCIKIAIKCFSYFSGNKGAVGISFYFRGTSFCFINSHLTSGNERNER
jgi:hypothetical protein